MPQAIEIRRSSPDVWLGRVFGRASSFVLAAAGAFTLTLGVVIESFNSTRVGAVLVVLLLLHVLRYPRLLFGREALIYTCFFGYMITTLIWTDDRALALNTLRPAATSIVVLVLFGSLAAYYDTRAILGGLLCGLLTGAAAYTKVTGFPLSYPSDFSYNAVAGMYLSGLFVALLSGCYSKSRLIPFMAALVFDALLVATTSIKFNLGVALGVVAAVLFYYRRFTVVLRRNLVPISIILVALAVAVASNAELMQGLQRGVDRVALGLEVLQARENVPGYSAFESRQKWQSDGLKGWLQNPLFGHGAEAFRDLYGITSHSTPVDVLYNFGLFGFVLFYAVFLSLIWRLKHLDSATRPGLPPLVLGMGTCYLFVSLSAPLHYNEFLAMFIATGAAVLSRHAHSTTPEVR